MVRPGRCARASSSLAREKSRQNRLKRFFKRTGNSFSVGDFAGLSGLPTAADDSGLEVFALGGQPGVRSRRFALHEGSPDEQDAANNAELLRRLAGAPAERRRARYRCVVVYLPGPGAAAVTFEGSCFGAIVEAPRGRGGFGYDPLFRCDELGKTFGEATSEEKHRVSHRGRAFRALAAWLVEHPIV